jgi:hypothetical protein
MQQVVDFESTHAEQQEPPPHSSVAATFSAAISICGGASILQSRHRGWRQLTSKTYDLLQLDCQGHLENDEQEWLLRVPRIDNNSEEQIEERKFYGEFPCLSTATKWI